MIGLAATNQNKAAHPACCRHISVHRQSLAAAEQQVIHGGKLAVKPNVDIDDRYTLQTLQLAEVGFLLPLLWDDSLHHINCT